MLPEQIINISSEAGMKQFAQKCAAETTRNNVITLTGDLGAGKTTFAREFIRTLTNQDTDVPSPTFTLVQEYSTNKGSLWHFDLYRLKNHEEIYEIGWEEAIIEGIILVEWPDRLDTLLPKKRTEILIEVLSNDTRAVTIRHYGTVENHAS